MEWAARARHEISEHTDNCFLTLTYDEESIPSQFIIKEDFQKFMKRLRSKTFKKIRYMVSYEYGTKKFRPHFHALLFGYSPKSQTFLKNTNSGYPLFTSEEISKLWPHGFHSIAEANEKTAYYIASYALKGKKRVVFNEQTGEECEISDKMNVSTRPAIGLNFLRKNAEQLVNCGQPLPRYYQKVLEKENPELFEEYQNKVATLINNRTSREMYAKFEIDSAKSNLRTSALRDAEGVGLPEIEERLRKFHRKKLKDDYEQFVVYNKKRN